MKYILIILLGLLFVKNGNAQFTGTDSLRNYNIRFITNNPATAFSNLRLHTLLRGIIDWVDTARAGTGGGGVLGIDTLWALNDSTVRYRKNGVFRNIMVKGVYDTRRKVDTAYALNDSTLQIKINGTNRNIILPGRHWSLQGVLNNGSTLAENENIILADSLELTSGWVIIDSIRLRSLPPKADTTMYKPTAVDASGNVVKLVGWPGGGGISDTTNKWANNIFTRNDSLFQFKGGASHLVTVIRPGTQIITLSRYGAIGDASLAEGSITFGTDNTAIVQQALNLAGSTPLLLIWDIPVSVTGLRIKSNTYILALEGGGAILRNNSDKAIFENFNLSHTSGVYTDSNIVIDGGAWNGNAYNSGLNPAQSHDLGLDNWMVGMRFFGVKNLRIENTTIIRARTFSVFFQNTKDVVCENNIVESGSDAPINSDGYHFTGPAENVIVNGLQTHCQDDALAFNADDGFDWYGPVTNVSVSNLRLMPGSLFGFRLLSGSSLIDKVKVENVTGSAKGYWCVIDNYWQDTAAIPNSGIGNIKSVTISDIDVEYESLFGGFPVNNSLINVNCNVDQLILKNIKRNTFATDTTASVFINGPATLVKRLHIDGYYSFEGSGSDKKTQHIKIRGGKVGYLNISNAHVDRLDTVNNSSVVQIEADAEAGIIQLENIKTEKTRYIINALGTIDSVYADNIIHAASDEEMFDIGSAVKVGNAFDSVATAGGTGLLNDLLAYWDLNEASGTRADKTSTYNLTSNNSTGAAAGILSDGADFVRASSNYLSNTSLNPTSSFTANAWVKLDNVTDLQRVFGRWDEATNMEWLLYFANGGDGARLRFLTSPDGTTTATCVSPTVTTGTFYMITVMFTGSQIKIYTNGSLSASASTSAIFHNAATSFRVGTDQDNQDYFDGIVDEMGVWNRVLTDDEITDLYNSGLAKNYSTFTSGSSVAILTKTVFRDVSDGLLKWDARNLSLDTLQLRKADSTGSPANMVWINPVTKRAMLAAVPTGADGNGIYGGNGTLPSDVTVSTGGNTLTVSGSNDNETSFSVTNTGTTSASAILGTATGTTSTGVSGNSTQYIGVFGNSTSSTGVQGQSSSGIGVVGVSSTSAAFRGQINPSSSNAIENAITILRTSSAGAGANGLGAAIQYELETATNGTSQLAGLLAFKWSDATNATRTSEYELYTVNSGTSARKFAIKGNGQLVADTYGAGTHSVTPATTPVYNSSGEIGERIAPKIYTALLTQSGTGNPTATILGTNEIGTIVWTRNSTGNYTGTLTGAFTADKTWLICQKGDGSGSFVNGLLSRGGANTVTLDVRDNSASVTDNFTNMSIEIRVYP